MGSERVVVFVGLWRSEQVVTHARVTMLYRRSDLRYIKLVAWEVYAVYEDFLDQHQRKCGAVGYMGGKKYSPITIGKYFETDDAFASAWVDGVYES